MFLALRLCARWGGISLVLLYLVSGVAGAVCDESSPLFASDGVSGDLFGRSVDVSEEWVAAGAPMSMGFDGAVYLYRQSDPSAERKLAPPPGLQGQFGAFVAQDGELLVVGEPAFRYWRGRVHIYRFDEGTDECRAR